MRKYRNIALLVVIVFMYCRIWTDENRINVLEKAKPALPQGVITPDSMMTMWGGQQTTIYGTLVLFDNEGHQWVPLLVPKPEPTPKH